MDKFSEPNWKDNNHLGVLWKERFDIARDTATSPKVLEELVYDENWQVREAAIINPTLDVAVLYEVASHSSWIMREAVAKNLKTPAPLLEALINDSSASVREVAKYRSENRSSAETVKRNPNPHREPEVDSVEQLRNFLERPRLYGGYSDWFEI